MNTDGNIEYFPAHKMFRSFELAHGSLTGREFYHSQAPGRVNLIGEHTDYHDGFVMPVAIDLKTYAIGAKRPDDIVRLYSVNLEEKASFNLSDMDVDLPVWVRYFAGGLWGMVKDGHKLSGADVVVWGAVPFGAGLSSSAAVEVAAIKLFQVMCGINIDQKDIARYGQWGENNAVNVPCGIMDQFASSSGEEGKAIMLDCRSLEIRSANMPDDWSIVVFDTGVHHQLASGEYGLRQEQCAVGLELIKKDHKQVKALRDVDMTMLITYKDKLDDLVYRRLMHVVEENDRVGKFADAIDAADTKRAGELMALSHASLKDNYEVSCDELDFAVLIASKIDGVIGSRMTGGGFGGSTVNLVRSDKAMEFSNALEEEYKNKYSDAGCAIITKASAGAIGGSFGDFR